MLRFRKLQFADLQSDVWRNQADFAQICQAISPEDTLFAAFLDDVPAGILTMKPGCTDSKPPCAMLDLLFIRPDCRRQGIGRILTALAAGDAVERQLWFLAAKPPAQPDAVAFAEAIHLRKTDWLSDFYVLDLSDVEGLRYG